MENNKKENNKTNSDSNSNYFVKLIKQNYKIIIIITISLILILIGYININNINIKKNLKGGSLPVQVAVSSLNVYGRLAKDCTAGAFIKSAERFNAIIDNLKFVFILIVAIVLIPVFPVLFYITAVYVIINSFVGNIIKT